MQLVHLRPNALDLSARHGDDEYEDSGSYAGVGRTVTRITREEVFHGYATERARGVRGFSSSALRALRAHDWPGNVRELLNRVRRAAVMADGPLIQPHDLGLEGADSGLAAEDLGTARAGAERLALQGRIDAGLSITSVARELGVSRMSLYRLMAKHGIQRPARRCED